MVKISDMIFLDDKDFLPEKYEKWELKHNSTGEIIIINGDMISQDKRISNISNGYMNYFRTDEGLKSFSAFNYTISKIS
jgi:hypothetical protein